jgi:heterodisulfide reductase subunit C
MVDLNIEAILKGHNTLTCYQCSRCTSSCPSALATGRFNPRAIIMSMLVEEPDTATRELVADDTIWMCVSCHSCEEACPKGVRVAEVVTILRNMGYLEGRAPKAYISNVDMILASGMVVARSGVDRTRSRVGLGEMRFPDMEEIRTLLKDTIIAKRAGDGK